MFAESDPRLRLAVGEIIAGFAFINFGVVVAILADLPITPNDQAATAVRVVVAALLGVAFAIKGADEFRK